MSRFWPIWVTWRHQSRDHSILVTWRHGWRHHSIRHRPLPITG